jgi:Putative peptidoglycan binding domain/L,D-transpeptidase catalytic domain
MRMKLGQRWLAGLGAVTAAGAASLLGLSTIAAAQTAAPARVAAPAHAVALSAVAAPAKTLVPDWTPIKHTLRPGDHGRDVRKVQERLWKLGYWPGKVDGQFGADTIEAVWAFKEVQGIQLTVNPDNIGPATERALADPKDPVPLTRHHEADRIDVNLHGGYLVLYRHGRVRLISHISPGGGYYFCDPPPNQNVCGNAITPPGNYKALEFLAGNIKVPLGFMFNSVFFIGREFAIHGGDAVPLEAVSHGCVRIPTDTSLFFHKLFKIPGTPIYVRNHIMR